MQVLELEPNNVEAQAMLKMLQPPTPSPNAPDHSHHSDHNHSTPTIPPHTHKGPMPLVLLTTDQKWSIPNHVTKRAYVCASARASVLPKAKRKKLTEKTEKKEK